MPTATPVPGSQGQHWDYRLESFIITGLVAADLSVGTQQGDIGHSLGIGAAEQGGSPQTQAVETPGAGWIHYGGDQHPGRDESLTASWVRWSQHEAALLVFNQRLRL